MRNGFLRALLVCALATAGTAAPARAADMQEFPVGGSGDQTVWEVAPGADGSIFFLQQWVGTASGNPGDQMRVGKLDGAGNVVASSVVDGNASYTTLSPTADGGAWMLNRAMSHVAPGGAVSVVAPESSIHYGAGLATGTDGDAWTLTCLTTCDAVRVRLDGTVTHYVLPSFPYATGWGDARIIAVHDGVWLSRTTNDGAAQAAYVSNAGIVTDVVLPSGTVLVAPVAGNDVWWSQESTYRIGQVSPTGTTSAVRTVAAAAGSTLNAFGDGRGGVIWTERPPDGNNERDGRIGMIGSGGDHTFDVPAGASAVTGSNGWLWGSCTFGSGAFGTRADSAAWVLSAGHPDRISRETTSGELSTFSVPSASVADAAIRGVAESTSGMLWFAIQSSAGPRVARADPRNPPAGLARPASEPGQSAGTTPAAKRAPHLRLRLVRRHGLRVRVVATVRHGARGRIRVRVRTPHRVITRTTRRGRLSFTFRARGHIRVAASFAGRTGWRSRSLPARRLTLRRAG